MYIYNSPLQKTVITANISKYFIKLTIQWFLMNADFDGADAKKA